MKITLTKHLLVVGALVMLIGTIGACKNPIDYIGHYDADRNCIRGGHPECVVGSMPQQ
ncbi:MAG: hypothetical protein ACE5FH_06390 [Candidatus Zixiibacteriota bacterium]